MIQPDGSIDVPKDSEFTDSDDSEESDDTLKEHLAETGSSS